MLSFFDSIASCVFPTAPRSRKAKGTVSGLFRTEKTDSTSKSIENSQKKLESLKSASQKDEKDTKAETTRECRWKQLADRTENGLKKAGDADSDQNPFSKTMNPFKTKEAGFGETKPSTKDHIELLDLSLIKVPGLYESIFQNEKTKSIRPDLEDGSYHYFTLMSSIDYESSLTVPDFANYFLNWLRSGNESPRKSKEHIRSMKLEMILDESMSFGAPNEIEDELMISEVISMQNLNGRESFQCNLQSIHIPKNSIRSIQWRSSKALYTTS